MGILNNGGRELGQWPPLPLKHFRQKWNPHFGGYQCKILATFWGKAR